MKISDALLAMQWAVLEEHLVRMDQCINEVSADGGGGGEGSGGGYSVSKGIATIPLKGTIFQERTLLSRVISYIFGGTILSDFVAQVQKAAADDSVHSIVLDVNSPGGEALGIEAAAGAIAAVTKPTVAYVDGMAASAAYWLASATNRIVLSGETSQVGSIGVVLGLRDSREADAKSGVKRHEIVSSQSPLKRPDPSTDEGMAVLKSHVDALAEVFISNVAAGRGVDAAKVKSDFGKGSMVLGADAVSRGMADEVSSRGALLSTMRSASFNGFGGAAANEGRRGTKSMKTPEELAAEKKAADQALAEAEAKAKAAGTAEGKTAERARVASILGCDEAKTRPALALKLASTTDLDVEAAKGILGAAAEEKTAAADPLGAAMGGVKNPRVGAGNGDGGELDEAGEIAAINAAAKTARGGK